MGEKFKRGESEGGGGKIWPKVKASDEKINGRENAKHSRKIRKGGSLETKTSFRGKKMGEKGT